MAVLKRVLQHESVLMPVSSAFFIWTEAQENGYIVQISPYEAVFISDNDIQKANQRKQNDKNNRTKPNSAVQLNLF